MRKSERGEYERVTVRLPEDLARDIRRVAQRNERTLNAEIIRAVRAHVMVGGDYRPRNEGTARERALDSALRPQILALSDTDLARAVRTWMGVAQRKGLEKGEDPAHTIDFFGPALGWRWKSGETGHVYPHWQDVLDEEGEVPCERIAPTGQRVRAEIMDMSPAAFDTVVLGMIVRGSETELVPGALRNLDDALAFYEAAIDAVRQPGTRARRR